ncbi:hypothetical protein ELY33_09825 [Vreelandella andesensis]|uniref:Curlin subunit CsgB n=1 Tax=Vreelandella andesensis TaxID=447567 RepID=A0A3S0WIT3_9GAMM|nr:hypothetical protein [Halomonas andesensis]RUR30107.1 hypothetical protein ELY33_09825 [Halomonas andesensis]
MKPLSLHSTNRKAGIKRYFASLVVLCLSTNVIMPVEANDSILVLLKESSRIAQYVDQIDASALQGNISIIEQQGSNNNASVVQSRSASYQLANFSHIYQRGNNNSAFVNQMNGNNVGVVWQVGNNHTANINQQGNSLSFRADIYQLGFSGDVSISQSGSGLRGVSVQQQNFSGNARPVTIDTY